MKPWLLLPPQLAHALSPLALQLYSLLQHAPTPAWKTFVWKNIVFKNRLGLAGGLDKDAELLNVWGPLGCGFVEIGTVVPEPQAANAGKIMDRSLDDQALWNQMGFPSNGADEAYYNLKSYRQSSSMPVFVNIGKNRSTANETAYLDYVFLLEKFYALADAFVVNVSSPNTVGLRDLATSQNLKNFLNPILTAREKFAAEHAVEKPVLIKLSPDLPADNFKAIIDTCLEAKIDGFVLTNTTLSRTTIKRFPETGGVSGKPLQHLSKKALQIVCNHLGPDRQRMLLISVGGVMTADDVFERIELGADLVEVYSALIFEGPGFFKNVARKFYGKNGKQVG